MRENGMGAEIALAGSVPLFVLGLDSSERYMELEPKMNTSPKDTGSAPGDRIAFIKASWHSDMTDRARDGFTDEMKQRGFDTSKIDCFDVPGAYEIPLTAMKLIASERYAAVIACGFVVDGGIYRHDFVASAVVDGLMRVQLDTGVPVFSVVLTPHHFHETEDHTAFFREHMVGKGREAAGACLAVLALEETLTA
tara:strand:- start:5356 stop:5940 length:585 start_codon:yes stop_codon:yes gene_type:complete